jgi:hypothetical protein
MSYPSTATVTLSSSGVSTPIQLDPTARTTTLQMAMGSVTSTSTTAPATVRIELTLDTWTPQNPAQAWQNASSLTYITGSSGVNANPDGAFISVLGPIAGARLNSTAWAPATGSLTLKALQSQTAGP